jgi:hypothetical protein
MKQIFALLQSIAKSKLLEKTFLVILHIWAIAASIYNVLSGEYTFSDVFAGWLMWFAPQVMIWAIYDDGSEKETETKQEEQTA